VILLVPEVQGSS